MSHQQLLFCHVRHFCMKNWKTTQYNISKNVCFSFSACCFPIRQVKSTRKLLHALKVFPNLFLFVCFHDKITWHLGKVKKKVKNERGRNCIDAQSLCLVFTSLNVPPCSLPKTTDKLLLKICTVLCTEALFRPLFTKYAHCKPLLSF